MFNKYLLTFVLAAICALVSTTEYADDIDPVLMQQQFALRLVKHTYSKRLGIASRATEDECFDQYLSEQAAVTREYNQEFNNCRKTARDDRDKLTQESNKKRSDVVARGEASCQELVDCQQIEDGLEFFNCYSEASSENSGVLYSLHTESSTQALNMKVFYAAIENEEKNCTVLAKNKYVQSLANSNINLQKCLDGELEPGTTVPSTSEPSPSEPSTNEPSTNEPSTNEPSTNEPSPSEPSTNKPSPSEPSTNEPSPSEPSTNEPSTNEPSPSEPSTNEPSTNEPSTNEPSPSEPSTNEPSTNEPSPSEPSTNEPSTLVPSTSEPDPSTVSTDAPQSAEDPKTTTEQSPEEDLFLAKSSFNLWNKFRKLVA